MKDNVIVVNFTNKDKKKYKKNKKKSNIFLIIYNKIKKVFSKTISFLTKKSLSSPYKNRYKNRYK